MMLLLASLGSFMNFAAVLCWLTFVAGTSCEVESDILLLYNKCVISIYICFSIGKRNRVHLTIFRLSLVYAKNFKCTQTLDCYQYYQANHKIKETVILLIYLVYLHISTTFKNAHRRHHFLIWQ